MAVSFNNLLNDDGSNTVGTLMDKTQMQLLLQGSFVTSTSTGSVNNWAPPIDGHTFINWNGASDVTFTGLAGGIVGLTVTVRNITGAKVATFAHQSGSSSAGNKFTNIVTSAATSVGPGGSIAYRYDGTDWQMVGHDQGTWLLFTPTLGGSTSESGQVYSTQSGRYLLRGRTVLFSLRIILTTLGTITGNAIIKGLPFTCLASASYGSVTIPLFSGLTTSVVLFAGNVSANTTTIGLGKTTAAATTVSSMVQGDFSNTSDILAAGYYETS